MANKLASVLIGFLSFSAWLIVRRLVDSASADLFVGTTTTFGKPAV